MVFSARKRIERIECIHSVSMSMLEGQADCTGKPTGNRATMDNDDVTEWKRGSRLLRYRDALQGLELVVQDRVHLAGVGPHSQMLAQRPVRATKFLRHSVRAIRTASIVELLQTCPGHAPVASSCKHVRQTAHKSKLGCQNTTCMPERTHSSPMSPFALKPRPHEVIRTNTHRQRCPLRPAWHGCGR